MYKLLKDLDWSPDGCYVERILAGQYQALPNRALEISSALGILEIEVTPAQLLSNNNPDEQAVVIDEVKAEVTPVQLPSNDNPVQKPETIKEVKKTKK